MNDLFIRSLFMDPLDWAGSSYIKSIKAIRNTAELAFHGNITFFVGENGSGKSTMLEAIAIACGLNPEGGTVNYDFHTYDDYSDLSNSIHLRRGSRRPKWSYFLRAESFYNLATVANTRYESIEDYHARSHGESILDFILDNDSVGLYLMDEPEAALSPQRQLSLLVLMDRMAKEGSQFIIATHSPILLAVPGATIYAFDDDGIREIAYEDCESYRIMKLFLDDRERFLARILSGD